MLPIVSIRHHSKGLGCILCIKEQQWEVDGRQAIVAQKPPMVVARVLDDFGVGSAVGVDADKDGGDGPRKVIDPRACANDDLVVAAIRMDLLLLIDHELDLGRLPTAPSPVEDAAGWVAPVATARDAIRIATLTDFALRAAVGIIGAVDGQL